MHVQRHPRIGQSLRISFRASPLAHGGYYYAVIVLRPYKHYTRSAPPPCSTSSNMQRADYGYPQRGAAVALALTPAQLTTNHWCPGGTYTGAIYAVSHKPPCEGAYPCRSEPYEPSSACWNLEGHRVCGVVVLPQQYSYPSGLPAPLASGTRIIGRFAVTF